MLNKRLTTILLISLSVACGGTSAVEQNVIDRTTELRKAVEATAPSPERERALSALDKVIASAGKLQPDSIAEITPPVMMAATDGTIDARDAEDIERAVGAILP